jgi:hypothetical protein
MEAGRDFLEALQAGEISHEEFTTSVPAGVTLMVREGVPSNDFVLGRIYQSASDRAYKELAQWKDRASPLKVDAENFYANRNCELIK